MKKSLEEFGIHKSADLKSAKIDDFMKRYELDLTPEDILKFAKFQENQPKMNAIDSELLRNIMDATVGLNAGDDLTCTYQDANGDLKTLAARLSRKFFFVLSFSI